MQDVFTKGMTRWFAVKEFQVGIPTEDIDQSFSLEDFQSRAGDFIKLSRNIGRVIGVASRLLPHAKRLEGLAARAGKLRGVGKLGGKVERVGDVAVLVTTLSEFLIDTKTTAAHFYEALKPYMSKADLIGLKISDARLWSTFRESPENKTFWNTVLVPVIYADQLTPASILQRFDEFLRASDPLRRLGLRVKFVGNRARIYPLLVYFDSQKLAEDRESLWPQFF